MYVKVHKFRNYSELLQNIKNNFSKSIENNLNQNQKITKTMVTFVLKIQK